MNHISPVASSPPYELIIIGAGISGLVAAFEAIKKNIDPKRILFLEAADEIGGRAKTVHYAGRYFDTGAHWFHGGRDNEFYKWLKENFEQELKAAFNVKEFDDIFEEDRLKPLWLLDRDGCINKNPKLRRRGYKAVETLYKIFQKGHAGQDISLAQLVKNGPAIAQAYAQLTADTWMALPTSAISVHEFFGGTRSSGGLIVRQEGGIGKLVGTVGDVLCRKGVVFKTRHRVNQISYSADEVGITCQSSEGIQHYQSAAAYVTASVGVLNTDTMAFDPALPPEVRNVLAGMQMAKLEKACLPLEEGYIRNHPEFRHNMRIDMAQRDGTGFAFNKIYNGQCEIVGRNPGEWLGFSDLHELLHQLNQHVIGDPLITRWRYDPLTLGSYSACIPGYERPERPVWIDGRVCIGGEACVSNRKEPSTMEGACAAGMMMAADYSRQYRRQSLILQ